MNDLRCETLDLKNPDTINDIYKFLLENYVEDDQNTMRFAYSKEFLEWALMPPNYLKELHICIRKTNLDSDNMIGIITGTPIECLINNQKINTIIVNFLCVHKKFRQKK